MWPRALVRVALRGPGKHLLLASGVGWIAMVWTSTPAGHAGHSMPASASPDHFMALWLAMILAMTPPLLLREIGRLWRTSLRRLRHLTIASFLFGYVGVWLMAGVPLSRLADMVSGRSERIVVVIALIACWQCSPARQRCLNACHRVPALRAFGAAAQRDSLRYGISTGGYCVAACGLVMLLVLLANDDHLTVMTATTVVMTLERYLPARRPAWHLPVFSSRSPDWPDLAFTPSLFVYPSLPGGGAPARTSWELSPAARQARKTHRIAWKQMHKR